MQKADEWQVSIRDLELITFLADHSVKQAALEFNGKYNKKLWTDPEGAIRAWIYRARLRIKRYQSHLNKIYALQKRSARVRKLTISGALEEDDEN